MPQRHFSVIVHPDAWDASLEKLARAVAPMTSVRAKQLVPVLERGDMTLDADLSREEADRLFERLASLDVPARIVDGEGELVRDFSDTEAGPEASEAQPETTSDAVEPDQQEHNNIALDIVETDDELPVEEEGWESFLGDVEVEDVDVPTPTDDNPDNAEPAPSDNQPAKKKKRSSTMIGAPGPAGAESAESEQTPPEKPGPAADEVAAQFGAEPIREPVQDTEADEPPPKDPPKKEQPKKEASPPPQIPSRGVEGDGEAESKKSRPEPKPKTGRSGGSVGSSEKGFDASRMNAALETDSDRPPFEPDGFDDRNEHIPALAAALSLFAPGAGQTYNGEPEKSWEFGIRFALLVPWYKSVKQAWERAEKIRTYYAPRPKEGALIRAFKYAASWWIIVGGVVALLGFGGYAGYNALTRPERPKITEADIQSAHDEARRQIRLARIGGLDGVSNYLDERDGSGGRFTMSEEERVERLFRRGYQSCESGEYSTCEAVMKRVSSLSPKYRREAYKLQAWASMQRSPDSPDQPMPSVEVESLETFETRDLNADDPSSNDSENAPEPPGGDAEKSADGAPELDLAEDSEDAP